MLRYLKAVIIFGLLLPNSLAYSQYRASDNLWTLSDEILLIKVTNEEFELAQSLHCTSFVTVEVLKNYKSTRLAADLKQLVFTRLYDCSKKPVVDSAKLKRERQYIIFLSSQPHGEVQRAGEAKERFYSLADIALGIQEYTDQLEEFLLTKQREKR